MEPHKSARQRSREWKTTTSRLKQRRNTWNSVSTNSSIVFATSCKLFSKQVSIHHEEREMQQARKLPGTVEKGRSEVDMAFDQVSGKGILIEVLCRSVIEDRKVLAAAKRVEHRYALEAQKLRNQEEIEEISQRMKREQERIEVCRKENEGLVQEVIWLEGNKASIKEGRLEKRLEELVCNHEFLMETAIENGWAVRGLLARVESPMFNFKEGEKEEMRWKAAKLRGEGEVLQKRIERCEAEIEKVSRERTEEYEAEISAHELEVRRRQQRILVCKDKTKEIGELQRRIRRRDEDEGEES